ncbi:hypothetical protein [Methylobacterium haplocladii]|nr:hypothetical protein [Methylobacterium haplocladii]
MILVSGLWPGLAGALLLGACIGAIMGLPRERFGFISAGISFAMLAILAGIALLQTVPGLAGLWVETASLMLGAYLLGCLVGGAGQMVAKRG